MEPEPLTRKECLQIGFGGFFAVTALLVVFFFARQDGIKRRCQSNLHRLGLGQLQYMRDYDERTFPSSNWALLLPYIKSQDLFSCPTASHGYTMSKYIIGMSFSGNHAEPWKNIPAFYDSSLEIVNANDKGESWIPGGRHRGGNNVVFMDCHVEWMEKKPTFRPIPISDD